MLVCVSLQTQLHVSGTSLYFYWNMQAGRFSIEWDLEKDADEPDDIVPATQFGAGRVETAQSRKIMGHERFA
jgi:hypothetical protein